MKTNYPRWLHSAEKLLRRRATPSAALSSLGVIAPFRLAGYYKLRLRISFAVTHRSSASEKREFRRSRFVSGLGETTPQLMFAAASVAAVVATPPQVHPLAQPLPPRQTHGTRRPDTSQDPLAGGAGTECRSRS